MMLDYLKEGSLSNWLQNQDDLSGQGLSFYTLAKEDLGVISLDLEALLSSPFNKIKMSSFEQDLESFDLSLSKVLIIQDLDLESFLKKVIKLVDKVIYPANFKEASIIFLSKHKKEAYKVGAIDSRLIHQNLDRVSQLLSLEQMDHLLDMRNHAYTLQGKGFTKIKAESFFDQSKLVKRDQPIPLEELNKEQLIAVEHLKGPMRVLAPAGSGKTKTLVNRIVNLVNEGVETRKILALAFNKKAQAEMKERLNQHFNLTSVQVDTFHAFGNDIIAQSLAWHFDAKNEAHKTRGLLGQVLSELKHPLHLKRNTDPLDVYLESLSKIKNELYSEAQMKMTLDDGVVDFSPIFNLYILKTAREKFYNFDDMVYLALRKILSDSELRLKLQRRYQYILVDEFQDLNKAQLLLLKAIALPENNVFVCGDDDQMIYSFRGAEIDNILNFTQKDSITKDQVLELNYRSSSNIVKQSKWLIDKNKQRVYKNIRPFNGIKGTVDLLIADSLKDQAEAIVVWIKKLKEKPKSKWSDFAILYRYNEYKDLLYMVLKKHNLPVDSQGISILNTSVGRTIVAYLSILLRPENTKREELEEVLKRPNKFLTNDFISTVRSLDDLFDTRRGQNYLHQNSYDNYLKFVEAIKNFELIKENPRHVIQSIISTFDFQDHYESLDLEKKDHQAASNMDVLEIIVAFASIFDSIEDFYTFFLNTNQKQGKTQRALKDVIHLSSVHKTKGNEYKHVAYFNVSEASTKDVSQKDFEEERRIAYVAITRAEESVFVTTQKGSMSPFIKEMFLNPSLKDKNVRSLKLAIHELTINLKNKEDLKKS